MNTDTPAPTRKPRRRVAIGPARPQYLSAAELDKLTMIVTALAVEVSALRDRIDTHEALAEQSVAATSAAVECARPDDARLAARENARMGMLRRVFRVVTEEIDALRETGADPSRRNWTLPAGWDKT